MSVGQVGTVKWFDGGKGYALNALNERVTGRDLSGCFRAIVGGGDHRAIESGQKAKFNETRCNEGQQVDSLASL